MRAEHCPVNFQPSFEAQFRSEAVWLGERSQGSTHHNGPERLAHQRSYRTAQHWSGAETHHQGADGVQCLVPQQLAGEHRAERGKRE